MPAHLSEHWRAFAECSATRSTSWGVERIKHAEILAWCDTNGIEPCDRREFSDVIRSLDSIYIESAHSDTEEPQKTEASS